MVARGSPSFLKRMCIGGGGTIKCTILVPFLSKFIHIGPIRLATILRVARGQHPLPIENFVFGGLNF